MKDKDLVTLRKAAAQLRSEVHNEVLPDVAAATCCLRRSVMVYPEEMMFLMVRVTAKHEGDRVGGASAIILGRRKLQDQSPKPTKESQALT